MARAEVTDMRAWLAAAGVVALAGCNPMSCNPVSKTSQSAYAVEIWDDGRKALGEAMKLMDAGYPSAAMAKLVAWDNKAADTIKRIEHDPALTPADRKELVRKTTEIRENVDQLIRAIASGGQ
jgi:hypothetical protein